MPTRLGTLDLITKALGHVRDGVALGLFGACPIALTWTKERASPLFVKGPERDPRRVPDGLLLYGRHGDCFDDDAGNFADDERKRCFVADTEQARGGCAEGTRPVFVGVDFLVPGRPV